jgi:hypothetical protein
LSQQGINNIEHQKFAHPRMLLELAGVLVTTPGWLLYVRGPKEWR